MEEVINSALYKELSGILILLGGELNMAKKKKMSMKEAHKGCCCKYMPLKLLVLGVLILLNAHYGWMNWAYFVGGVIALKGLIWMIVAHLPCCK